jgi:hypothetical protein
MNARLSQVAGGKRVDILIFVIFLIAGVALGHSGKLSPWITDSLDRILMVVIYGLLLLVGIEVGSYREIFSQLGTIGLKSLVLTLGAVTGSGLLCLLVLKRG